MATVVEAQASVKENLFANLEATLSANVKSGRRNTSQEIAKLILRSLTAIVKDKEWKNARDLIRILRQFGKKLIEIDPTETIVGNIVRRVLKIVRDDYLRVHLGHSVDQQKMLLPHVVDDYATPYVDLKDHILESIDEFEQEMDYALDNITQQAEQLINDGEVILTYGKSRTVEAFLKAAKETRSITVVIVEGAPKYYGHEMARNLGNANIASTLIHDSAVFAIMGRVHKVILGTHSVMADGGLKTYSGAYAVACASKHYSVPLIVCTPVYKLTPQFVTSEDQIGFNKLESPQEIFDFCDGDFDEAEILNPTFDYVPPELVPLFIFNVGGNSPSYVYRLLSELYHPDDYNLTEDP